MGKNYVGTVHVVDKVKSSYDKKQITKPSFTIKMSLFNKISNILIVNSIK